MDSAKYLCRPDKYIRSCDWKPGKSDGGKMLNIIRETPESDDRKTYSMVNFWFIGFIVLLRNITIINKYKYLIMVSMIAALLLSTDWLVWF